MVGGAHPSLGAMPIGPHMQSMSLGCAIGPTAILCQAKMPAMELTFVLVIMMIAMQAIFMCAYMRGGALCRYLSRNLPPVVGSTSRHLSRNLLPMLKSVRSTARRASMTTCSCVTKAIASFMNLCLCGTQRKGHAVRDYLCGYFGRVKATFSFLLKRRRPSPCIQVLESPTPTRTPTTPKTTPAQRRGGMRRSMPRLRRYRVLFNPRRQGECGYDCLLRMMKRRTTPSERRSIRRMAAYCSMMAYEQDRNILGHSVRHLVHSLEMTSYEYGLAVRQGLWASPMDLALLADFYDLTFTFHLGGKAYMIGNRPDAHHLLLKNGHYLLVRPRCSSLITRTTRVSSPRTRGGGRGQARGQAKPKAKPAPKRHPINLYARPGAQGQRRYRLRSPPRSPTPQPEPPSPPEQPIDLEQHQHDDQPPLRSVSPTMTFSTQIERERQHQRAQQPDCCISSSDDTTDRSDEDDDLNIYRSPAYPIRHTSRLTRTARRPLTTRTGLQVNWAIRAHPSASALEVAEQITQRYHLMDSPQVHPLDAVYWEDTQELILPPVVMLPTHYRDLRRGLWEPRQPTRFVPVIHGTHILCDIAISMHTDPAELIRRVEAMRMEPPRVHLAVFPPHIWVLFLSHADPVPPLVRARGGMRPMPGAAHHTMSSS